MYEKIYYHKIRRGKRIVKKIMYYIGERAFICGGFVRYCLSKRNKPIKANDIDLYAKTEKDFEFLKNHFQAFKKVTINKETPVSISYDIENIEYKVQLIKPIKQGHLETFGSIESILDNFDFSIVRAGIFQEKGNIMAIADNDFYHDEGRKILRIKNIHCPIAEIYRVSKYMKKGYWLPTVQALRILENWNQRDVQYRSRIANFLSQENLTQDEIEELEVLLHID